MIILIAEDNRADEMLIRRALRQYKLELTIIALDDGDKVIDYIKRADAGESAPIPDLLLLDLNLPKRNGEEVLSRLRQSPRLCHIPVLIVTSSDSPKDRAMAERLGAANYFQKPPDLDEFMKIGSLVKEIIFGSSKSIGHSAEV